MRVARRSAVFRLARAWQRAIVMRLCLLTPVAVLLAVSRAAVADPPTVGHETITIVEHKAVTMPRPHRDPALLPPYNDQIMLADGWTRAWVLLDVSDAGVVRRVKFLKHPGYGLDKIAVAEAFKQSFEPARDKLGNPAASLVVYKLEWPAHEWMLMHELPMTRMPNTRLTNYVLPPCKGEGPWQMDSVLPSEYRDCSVPDLSHADASEPWFPRP